jgi:hypothetical protein
LINDYQLIQLSLQALNGLDGHHDGWTSVSGSNESGNTSFFCSHQNLNANVVMSTGATTVPLVRQLLEKTYAACFQGTSAYVVLINS